MRTITELYEPKFHKLTKIKIQGALFMPNLFMPIPKPGIRPTVFRMDQFWSWFLVMFRKF